MTKIMFVSRITAIKDILVDPASYQQRTLLVVGLTFYTLTLITFSSCTMPLGLFTPTILVGASLGGACGNLLKQTIDGSVFPSTFALLGVASMLTGIQHSTVSVAVILVEGTGHIKVLLPVIVVVATFCYISQHIQQFDVFEAGIVIKKLAYLEHEKIPRYYDAIRVKDILIESHVLCLKDHETVGKLVEVLGNSPHQSFPVIETESGRFIGLVKRTQIVALLECGIFSKNKEICGFRSDRNGDALSYWAFCINDDRYEYLLSLPNEMRASVNKLNDKDEGQERRTLVNKEQKNITASMRLSLRRRPSSLTFTRSPSELSQDFCVVHRDESGSIVATIMNPYYNSYWVDLASVANTGTYIVTELCPVSKAYSLFTSLGLSHIVVINGEGRVVGVLSRANFLSEHIEESSGL